MLRGVQVLGDEVEAKMVDVELGVTAPNFPELQAQWPACESPMASSASEDAFYFACPLSASMSDYQVLALMT